ncbi:MAG: LruC domain-containing protein [Bacteroidota bacterium]|nr:LruC domain-containing protein [Bacteroidota bacterium]
MGRAIYFGLLVAIIGLFSCEKPTINIQDLDIEEVFVPENFSWRTDRTINFEIILEESGIVTISSVDKKIIYHKGFHTSIENYHVKLSIPAYEKNILVNSNHFDLNNENIVCDLRDGGSFKSLKNETRGKLLWWSFDKSDGANSPDKVSGINALINNGNFVPAAIDEGILLDGEESYINLDAAKSELSTFLQASSSISFWTRIDAVGKPNSAYIVHFRDSKTKTELRIEYSSSNQIRFIYNNWEARILLSERVSGVSAGSGFWHHFVMAWNIQDKSFEAFIDGESVGIFSGIPEWKPELTSVLLGQRSDDVHAGQNLIGSIDEFIVWDHPLGLTEVQQIYSESDFLINHFGFDENQGSTTNDIANAHIGQIHGADWDNGVFGSCLKFNGTSDWVEVENSKDIDLRGAITMMAWAKTEGYVTSKILEKGDWDGHGLGLGNWDGWNARIRTTDEQTHRLEWDGGRPLLNTWYHLALTYDGLNFRFYVNGEEADHDEIENPLAINSRIVCIGSNEGSQKFFPGSIDEVKIFSKCLKQTEIKTYYQDLPNSDADGDGVKDSDDDFPDNAKAAFENNYPAGEKGSLAFEDLWPGIGDYDFNDLVLDYHFTIISDANNYVSQITAEFILRAIGASFKNGFGFQFMGDKLSSEDFSVSGSILSENYITLDNNGLEKDQNRPTFIVFDNAYNVLHSPGGSGINTNPDAAYVDPVTITLLINLPAEKYSLADLNIDEFNPFVIVNSIRNREIHLPNHLPTNKVDHDLFYSSDDSSIPAINRYYKSQNNLPWALNIIGTYDYPIEKSKISQAYLFFTAWAVSSGKDYEDWYLDKANYRNSKYTY